MSTFTYQSKFLLEFFININYQNIYHHFSTSFQKTGDFFMTQSVLSKFLVFQKSNCSSFEQLQTVINFMDELTMYINTPTINDRKTGYIS